MSSNDAPTRRDFFKVAAAATGAIAIPQWLWGCASEATFEGRNFDWEAQASEIEDQGLYTLDDPGPWEGKEAVHIPEVTLNVGEGTITVAVMHVMEEAHYIPLVYARNQNGFIIGFQEFEATDGPATATFTIPRGTTEITAYAFCYLHNDWKNTPLDIIPEAPVEEAS